MSPLWGDSHVTKKNVCNRTGFLDSRWHLCEALRTGDLALKMTLAETCVADIVGPFSPLQSLDMNHFEGDESIVHLATFGGASFFTNAIFAYTNHLDLS